MVGGYTFLVSVQVIEQVVAYKKYAELVFDGIPPPTPTGSIKALGIVATIRLEV